MLNSWHSRLLLAMVAFLLTAGGLAGMEARGAWQTYSRAQGHLAALERLAQEPQYLMDGPAALGEAREELGRLEADLWRLQRVTWLLRVARPLVSRFPASGGDLSVAPELADAALNLTRAGEHVLDGLAPALEELRRAAPEDMVGLGHIKAALEEARPQLEAAQARLDDASRLRANMDVGRLSPRGRRYLELLDSALARLRAMVGVGLRSPEIVAGLQDAAAQLDGLRQLSANPADILRAEVSLQDYRPRLVRARETAERLDQLLSAELAERDVLSALPGVGGDLAKLHGILSQVTDVVRAAEIALGAVEPLFQVADGGLLGPERADRIEAGLESARADFLRARVVLSLKPENGTLASDGLSPLAGGMVTQVAAARDLLNEALAAAPGYIDALQDALGYGGARTYLVLGLDEDELRASGGFIAGVWEIKVERAEVTGLRFMYSPEVDNRGNLPAYPPPPEPLFKYLYAGYWLFRDSPWYADFPLTAQVIRHLYEIGQGYTVDGVVVLVQRAMASAIGATGPVELPGGHTVTADNLQEVLFWGIPVPPTDDPNLSPRVYATKTLGEATLARLRKGLGPEAALRLRNALFNSLRQKQVLLYSTDPRAQEILRRFNWDGKLVSPPGDYLMVVDSNLYGGKLNANLSQRVDYEVALSSQGPAQAQVHVTYRNPSHPQSRPCIQYEFNREDSRQGCYWGYLRVYAPLGAEVTSAPDLPLPSGSLYYRAGFREANTFTARNSEGDKLVMAGFFVLPPAEEKTVTIGYQLGPGVVAQEAGGRRQYRLTVQKQPGTVDAPLTVTVSFPPSWHVTEAAPAGYTAGPGYIVFETRPDTDIEFSATFEE